MGLLKLYNEVMTGQEELHTALLRPWPPSFFCTICIKIRPTGRIAGVPMRTILISSRISEAFSCVVNM